MLVDRPALCRDLYRDSIVLLLYCHLDLDLRDL